MKITIFSFLLSSLMIFIHYLKPGNLIVAFGDNLKGQSHEINVWLFGAQWIEKILLIFLRKGFFGLSTFSCFILKLKSPSGTSFGLFFAYEEYRYRANDSNSPADLYHASEVLLRYVLCMVPLLSD